jgi:hypothetical protein
MTNPASELVPIKNKPHRGGGQPGNQNARRHGAPLGNRNALKHGLYAHTFTSDEAKRLDENVLGEFKDEEALIHTLLCRCAESMKNEKMALLDYAFILRVVLLAVGRLESLHRTRKVIYDKQTTFDQVWEELKFVPPEED